MAILLGACGASVGVSVDVHQSGSGSVSVTVTVPSMTAHEVEDLSAGLPVADLREAGWVVRGPAPGPGGSTVVSASHVFSNLSQIPVLVGDIAGAGPVASRPFRLSVAERKGALSDVFVASGTIDLRCAVDCFDDPRLAATVGYALGLPPGQLDKLLGPRPDRDLAFRFSVVLPGRTTSADVPGRRHGDQGPLAWSPALGTSTSLAATSVNVNLSLLRHLVSALSAGSLVVLFSAAYLVSRRRRASGHRGRHRRDRSRGRLGAPLVP
jgi:hypothetical protein